MREVTVVPHSPRWKKAYREEAKHISAALGDVVDSMQHIGSTAIPGIYAKPIIDMLVEVTSLEKLDARSPSLEALGYEGLGENGIPGRRYFRREIDGVRTHHVHAFLAGAEGVVRHLAFRDYLIAHPARAQAYSELKREVAARCNHDINVYMEGKDAFIKAAEQDALAWAAAGGQTAPL